jgi:hypothetical protein
MISIKSPFVEIPILDIPLDECGFVLIRDEQSFSVYIYEIRYSQGDYRNISNKFICRENKFYRTSPTYSGVIYEFSSRIDSFKRSDVEFFRNLFKIMRSNFSYVRENIPDLAGVNDSSIVEFWKEFLKRGESFKKEIMVLDIIEYLENSRN